MSEHLNDAELQKPTVETSITISSDKGELIFSEISRLLNKEPSDVRSFHHITSWGSSPAIQSSDWNFSMKEVELNTVGEGVCDLFNFFDTDWAAVTQFCFDRGCEVIVISRIKIYDWDDRPLLELDQKAVKALSLVGATWRADIEDHSR